MNNESGHSQWDLPVVVKAPDPPAAPPAENAAPSQSETAPVQAAQPENNATQAQGNTTVQAAQTDQPTQPVQETPAQQTRTPPAVPEGWEARWADDKQAW